MDSAEARIIHTRLDGLVENMRRLADAAERMQETVPLLTALKVQQEQMLGELKKGGEIMSKHEDRLQAIERDLPGLRELRKWVVAGVLAGVGMLGTALVKLVIVDIPRIPPAPMVKHSQETTAP